jgi:hypothetical protein
MYLGGHLVPGNLVALCRDCNNRKRDKPPADFYTEDELLRLKPLLELQEELFTFKFDWEKWRNDRKAYLIEVGVRPEIAHAVTTDEDNPHFVGLPNKDVEIVISIDLAGILAKNAAE